MVCVSDEEGNIWGVMEGGWRTRESVMVTERREVKCSGHGK